MVQLVFNPFTSNFDYIGLAASDVVQASQGGTGQSSYTIGDILYASGTTTLSKLGIGSAGQTLTVSGGLPSWQTPSPVSITMSADNNAQGPASGAAFLITGGTTGLQTIANTSGEKITISGTLSAVNGGTGQSSYSIGDTLYASSTSALSKLAIGSSGQVLTISAGIPSWATPTMGTVTSVSGTANRITSTGGATPVIDISAAYVGQTSITTLGTITSGTWTGTNIALNKGGTNAALTASNGGIFYSTATAGAILSGTSTANQVLLSGSSTAPAWSTATYPATTIVSQLLYSSGTNTVTGLTTANDGVLITSHTGVPSWLAAGTTGQVLTATTNSPATWVTPTPTFTWSVITSSGALVVNTGVIVGTNALSLSLPATSAVGDTIEVALDSGTSWIITQGAGQQVRLGNLQTTSGAGGSLASTAAGDWVRLVCRTANTLWIGCVLQGNAITVV